MQIGESLHLVFLRKSLHKTAGISTWRTPPVLLQMERMVIERSLKSISDQRNLPTSAGRIPVQSIIATGNNTSFPPKFAAVLSKWQTSAIFKGSISLSITLRRSTLHTGFSAHHCMRTAKENNPCNMARPLLNWLGV